MAIVLAGDDGGVLAAAGLIASGGLVVVPTETVYGLAANALDFNAVAKIFQIKGRPSSNPVIVHVSSIQQARSLGDFNDRAIILAEAFWPGPLTIVVDAFDLIPANVTAEGSTVGIRMPNHALTLLLIEKCGLPLAAPSANRSEGISPTTVDDVIRSLGEATPPILDGGSCTVGIESTVVDVTGETARILRPGAISRVQIEPVLHELVKSGADNAIKRSPGQMRRHYAPTTPTILATIRDIEQTERSRSAVLYYSADIIDEASLLKTIKLPATPSGYAAGLYAALHQLDQVSADVILIETPPDTEEWLAVSDRLFRAAAPKVGSKLDA